MPGACCRAGSSAGVRQGAAVSSGQVGSFPATTTSASDSGGGYSGGSGSGSSNGGSGNGYIPGGSTQYNNQQYNNNNGNSNGNNYDRYGGYVTVGWGGASATHAHRALRVSSGVLAQNWAC